MEEIWKDIKGFEGLYEVSNLGRVRSLKDCNKRARVLVMKQHKNRCGYVQVPLHKNGKKRLCTVHRLVAEAFIPNPYNLPQVNHIDECKTNNIVTNLEYCDAKYNANHGTRTERMRVKNINHLSLSKRVYQYTLDGSFIRSYPSQKEAERQTGISQSNIANVVSEHSKRKTTGGYVWSYDPPTPTQTRVLF